MAPEVTPELVEKKNLQRAALRRQYLKSITNPHDQGVGHVFDPAIQRFLSMKVTKIEHFKETPKTVLSGFLILVLPIAATIYFIRRDRAAKEAAYRSGKVAYKDRLFKFA